MFRNLNNLGQRLNLSFTFYLPVGLHRFVSIGRYLGPVAALLLAGALQAVVLWWRSGGDDEILIQSQVAGSKDTDNGDNADNMDADGAEDSHADIDTASPASPESAVELATDTDMSPEDVDSALESLAAETAAETEVAEETATVSYEPAPLPWSPKPRTGLTIACQQLVLSVALGSVLVSSWDSIALAFGPRLEAAAWQLMQQPTTALAVLALMPVGFAFPQRSDLHSFVILVHSTCLLVPVMFLNAPLAMMAALLYVVPIVLDLHLNLSSFTALTMLVTSPLAYLALLAYTAGSLEAWMQASAGHMTQQVLVLGLIGVPVHWMMCSRACATT